MKAFVQLLESLARTADAAGKQVLLEDYFRGVPAADAAWALYLLLSRWKRSVVKRPNLIAWAREFADVPEWLMDECQEHVGDLAETLALLVPCAAASSEVSLQQVVEERVLRLQGAAPVAQLAILRQGWQEFDEASSLLWHKLITGPLRFGIERAVVLRALAAIAGVELPVMAHRVAPDWSPSAGFFRGLLRPLDATDEPARGHPFCPMNRTSGRPTMFEAAEDWVVEWNWDAPRVQLIRRQGACVLWSIDEEILNPQFPGIADAALRIPDDCVLEGWLAATGNGRVRENGAVLPHGRERQNPGADGTTPKDGTIEFMAFDLLEIEGVDCRGRPLEERRRLLEAMLRRAESGGRQDARVAGERFVQGEFFPEGEPSHKTAPFRLRLSPQFDCADWEAVARWRARSREEGANGVMLRPRNSTCGDGAGQADGLVWVPDQLTCLAVLAGVQPGTSGEDSSRGEYSLSVWDAGVLVPIAKLPAKLDPSAIDSVEAFVKANTTKRFGPVRSVRPTLVFEVAFEGVTVSTRHKAGVVLRSARIVGLRADKRPEEADSVESLRRRMAPMDCGGERPRTP